MSTSSRQSPRMSAERQGFDLVPLLNRPSNFCMSMMACFSQSYFETVSRSSSSRSRSPSHQMPKLTLSQRPLMVSWVLCCGLSLSVAPMTTSPLMLRTPWLSLLHISSPGWVGSMSAAMQRPTSLVDGIWKMTSPVRALRKSEPSRRFSWQSHTCSSRVVGSKAVRWSASPWPKPVL